MIGVAEKLMADLKLIKPDITQEQWLEQKLKWFDLAYKAIEKTVKG